MSEVLPRVDDETRQRLNERCKLIDGKLLCHLAEASLKWLRTNQQLINSLNVFPVPDGDTGTNMVLTMQSALDEMEERCDLPIGRVAHAIAHGALMGARGNSGVILSQLWRGFARALDELESMDSETFAAALDEARDTAYKGVVRPVEGTILTVSKDIALAAQEALANGAQSVFEILEHVVEAADVSVKNTPELLPVLKEAGVVDSGGMGLAMMFEGMLRTLCEQPLDQPIVTVQPLSALDLVNAAEAIEPGQDWEVVIDFRPHSPLDVPSFYSHLETLGTSIQVGEGDGLFRMHIHVPDKTEYQPIEYIKELGTVTNVAIENLMAQTEARANEQGIENISLESVEPGQVAIVAVAPGPGIARVFASLGVAAIVEGGQTMNPSTQELLNAFENLPTDKVIILPNNKNIILAAQQATELTVKQVSVIPAITVPQGIAALFSFDHNSEFDAIVEAMKEATEHVISAEITTSTRSVDLDGVVAKEGQIIGLLNGKLKTAGDNLEKVLIDTLDQAIEGETELITLYFGEDLKIDQANQLAETIREKWADHDVEVIEGGQPHYQLIVSIE